MAKAMYIHVPFCESICAYCDFERCRRHPLLTAKWLKRMSEDIDERKGESLATVYIGGGTPTCLSCSELDELLSHLDDFQVQEKTIEANPENLTHEKLLILKKHHINRISLGVQTLNDELIHLIGRHHNAQMITDRLKEIYNAGITNISVDMIYGLPSQTLETWLRDLESIASNPLVSHISIYSLTIEKHSAFGRNHVQKCEDELEEAMYFEAIRLLKEQGFEQYEISNFARKGKESLHNQYYWQYEDFIGLGCGAYGKENHIYYHLPFHLDAYVSHQLKREESLLEKEEEMFETLMMGLRMKKGIDILRFNERYQCNLLTLYKKEIQKNLDRNYLNITQNHLLCSDQGFGLLNTILLDFMHD